MSYQENQTLILLTEALNRAAQVGNREIEKNFPNLPPVLVSVLDHLHLWTELRLSYWFSNASRKEKAAFALGVYACYTLEEHRRNQTYAEGGGI